MLDPTTKPSPYRCFDDLTSIPLPTTLLDAAGAALGVLSEGLGAVPEGDIHPAQNLKTLASWLYLANGLSAKYDASIVAQTFAPARVPGRSIRSRSTSRLSGSRGWSRGFIITAFAISPSASCAKAR